MMRSLQLMLISTLPGVTNAHQYLALTDKDEFPNTVALSWSHLKMIGWRIQCMWKQSNYAEVHYTKNQYLSVVVSCVHCTLYSHLQNTIFYLFCIYTHRLLT